MNNNHYCGLQNHGNTCFFNSALQNIMRCSVFVNIISDLQIDHELINIFKEIFEDYKKNTNSSISPINLVRYYANLNKKYSIGSQDDADEVITYLIGEIDDIIKKKIKEGRIKNFVIKGDITLDKVIDYLFAIYLKTTIKCLKCSTVSTNVAKDYKLSLGLSSNKLNEIINNISDPETLNGENQYYCDKCKTNTDAIKSDKIVSTPKYLHVQLKRFKHQGRRSSKNDDDIEIPTTLKLPTGIEYKLRGSVHHMGSINGGHYIYNYNKNKNENFKDWICLDDSGVSTKDVSSMINHGYIFLYVKDK